MYGRPNITMMRSFRQDPTVTQQKLKPGTVRRIITYARPYKLYISLFLFATVIDALIIVVNPLLSSPWSTRYCSARSSIRASWVIARHS